MNEFYSDEYWDRELNQLLDDYKLKDIDTHTAVLNGVQVWIANYPYDYGTSGFSGRPSRRTIYRLRKRVKIDSMTVSEIRNYKLNQIL
jgi:hypothetical protein